MRLTGCRAYYRSTPPKMPSGMVELIEGLTRDVLKNNPTDIYGFCADHMKHLLEIRDGPIRKKYVTLEEKIARAQEKVRQRAEKRMQQQNNLHKEEISKARDINKTNESSPTTDSVIHKQQLVDSSEVELLEEPKEGLVTNEPHVENNTEKEIKNINETTLNECESTNQTSSNTIVEDLPVDDKPMTLSEVTDALLCKNKHLTDITDQNALKEHTNDEIPHSGEQAKTEESETVEFDEGNSEQHSSELIQPGNSDQLEKYVEDKEGLEAEGKLNNKTDEETHTQIVDVIACDAEDFQRELDNNPSNNMEKDQQSNDTQNPQDSIGVDVNNCAGVNNDERKIEEDSQETNTIDIYYKEPPTVELQDSLINSDKLDTLMETNTDNDIVTLITQESNHELNEHKSETNSELPQSFENHTTQNENTQHENQINGTFVEKNNNKNNDSDNIDTLTKSNGSPQISSQDSNMDLETAAITIQKVFRTFLFKSRADTVNEETFFSNEDDKKEECDFPITGSLSERRPHGITRMDTVLQTVNEEKSLSLSTDDSSTLSSAATVIQAHVRGFLVRNKLNSNKTISSNSLAASNSNEPSLTSLEMDNDQNKNKTVLNIHIVPEGGNYLSRDESLITSMDLSLDSSPPSSVNLHPLGYDKSERRKQLKREDAIQSISPPSNNSGKLSDDIDSVKELPLNDTGIPTEQQTESNVPENHESEEATIEENVKKLHVGNMESETIVSDDLEQVFEEEKSLTKISSDEMDVVTPFTLNEDVTNENPPVTSLMHSGEFHDAVLPTKVSRSDTSVASEFKNVLVYFLLWNHS